MNKRDFGKKFKNEKGAITILVLVSILFMLSFLITSLIIISNRVNTQKEIISQTKAIYEPKSTMEEIYRSYFGTENYSVLPTGYTELEYIESTGTQYINTGYYPKINTRVEMDLSFNGSFKTTGSSFISSGEASGDMRFTVNFGGASGQSKQIYYWLRKTLASGAANRNKTYTQDIINNRNTMILDRKTGMVTYANIDFQAESATGDVNGELKLFAQFDNTPFQAYNMRLYTFTIKEDNEKIMNLIPCLDASERPCLYDTISKATLYNQGTGEFRAGPENTNATVNVNGLIPIYNVEQLLAIGTGRVIAINGKYYTFSNNASYILRNNLEFKKEDYEEDYEDIEDWTPPDENDDFEGIFDYNGHMIKVTNLDNTISKYGNVVARLPKEYKELEYIASTGTQYIDTTVFLNNNSKVELKSKITEVKQSANCLFGYRNSNNKFVLWVNNNYLLGINIGSVDSGYLQNRKMDIINTVNLSKDGLYYNGELISQINNTVTFENTKTACLFAMSTNGALDNRQISMNVYYCKIYNNNNLVRDFVPCKSAIAVTNADGDTVPANTKGLYDLVEGKFYTNQNTSSLDDFTAGPEV